MNELPGETSCSLSPTLEIRDLHVSMSRGGHTHTILKGVNLRVHSGEITTLVGRSGSGKSTLAHVIHGLLLQENEPEIRGSIRIVEEELVGASQAKLRFARKSLVRVIPQDPLDALNPTMSVRRQMEEVCEKRIAAERLNWAGIIDVDRVMGSFPHRLSGGERQRVLIAMATATRVPLIIADEPTTGLDPENKAKVMALFRQLAAEGTAVLLNTHDLAVAERCDHMAILEEGSIVECAPTAKILTNPTHPYTAGLFAIRYDRPISRSAQLPTLKDRDAQSTPSKNASLVLGSSPWSTKSDSPDKIVLDMRQVSKTFHTRTLFRVAPVEVLTSVSLSVRTGECVALIGESGVGKSTFLKIAAGLLGQDSGTVKLAGSAPPQLVFQDPKSFLTPWLPIGEQIVEGLRSLKVGRMDRDRRLAEVLDFVGLDRSLAETLPLELSVGQCQRAVMARALAPAPRLLLCDEPISALDTSLAASMLNLFGRIRRVYGTAIVIATHDLPAARIVADRIYSLRDGKLFRDDDHAQSHERLVPAEQSAQ